MIQEDAAEIKATELLEKFSVMQFSELEGWQEDKEETKRFAIICCDEMIKTLDGVWADVAATIARSCETTIEHRKYLEKVKEHVVSS